VNSSSLVGGSPRYQLYDASDGAIIAAAPLEEKFWLAVTDVIELESEMRLPDAPADLVIERVAKLIGSKPGEHWRAVFAEADCCCSVVSTLQEALSHPHFSRESRGGGVVRTPSGKLVPALPIPLAPHFCVTADREVDVPKLGEVTNPGGGTDCRQCRSVLIAFDARMASGLDSPKTTGLGTRASRPVSRRVPFGQLSLRITFAAL
jgi:crotonobetainyl-CoA:carnitine CoA-transferase CaiB-like acyl-CoA transferase